MTQASETPPAFSRDPLYVSAFMCGDKGLQKECYLSCRQSFMAFVKPLSLPQPMEADLFHESFETLWFNIERGVVFLDGSEVKVKSANGIHALTGLTGPYFLGIVRNKYHEFGRERNLDLPLLDDTLVEGDPADALPDSEDLDALKDSIIMSCLHSLPKSCVEILTKFYHESKSLADILAERPQNSTYNGLKTRKSKCLAALRLKIINAFKAHNLNCP